MKKFKKLSIFLLIASVAVTILVLSGCTVDIIPHLWIPNIVIPTPIVNPNPIIVRPQPIIIVPRQHTIFRNNNTTSLDCAGVWEDGGYHWGSFSLSQPAVLRIQVTSYSLPPSDFDIYIMTQSQYNNYYQIWDNNGDLGNASYLYEWDLTNYYNNYTRTYYLNVRTHRLPPGNYYILLANNYYQSWRGIYGSAIFSLVAYY